MRLMFSITTVASSTSMPTARARPPSVMMLMVSLRALRMTMEVRMDRGIETAMITVLRQLPMKSRIINPVRAPAITPSRTTPLIALRTNTDWSASGVIFISGGRIVAARGSSCLILETTLNVEAVPDLRIVTSTPRWPSWRTTFVCTANPSLTRATSLKQVGNTTTYLRDVAPVSDGFSRQTNVVRQDGHPGVLVTILKSGTASTLSVVSRIKQLLPRAATILPPEMKITPLADQSVFVRSAISGVVREGVIAGALTGLMILLFIGSWRSTVIIAVSIPLSILTSILILSPLG